MTPRNDLIEALAVAANKLAQGEVPQMTPIADAIIEVIRAIPYERERWEPKCPGCDSPYFKWKEGSHRLRGCGVPFKEES
jgi:hypothetical protein